MPMTFVLLGAAFMAVWIAAAVPSRRTSALWQLLLFGACLAALYDGLMTWLGVPLAAAVWLTAYRYTQAATRSARLAWGTAAILVAAALATHRMPGFGTYIVAKDIQLTSASAPMTVTATFDKGFAGVLLLAWFCRPSATWEDWRRAAGYGFLFGAVSAAVVVSLAVAVGAVRFDPKLHPLTPAWMAANLFLTCAFEEALFRGVVQGGLRQLLAQRPRWSWAPLAIASVLFGLVHAGGGPILICLAAIAGVGYGLAYALSGRIEASILAHLVLNAVHFILFTYPYAVR